jgi:hypothetical protein
MLFGLACEGPTDQITIKNILCGYFKNSNLDAQDIKLLQPPFDKSDQTQIGGGWTVLLKHYLPTERFREDVFNSQFFVIQVDTDVSDKKGFDVSQVDGNNQPLAPKTLISHVINRLIAIIDSGESGFYQQYAKRIIFAISVHSLECWLYAHYSQQLLSEPKITDCYKALSDQLFPQPIGKNRSCYDKLSKDFLERINIDAVAAKDPSFRIFIQSLAAIETSVFNRNDAG